MKEAKDFSIVLITFLGLDLGVRYISSFLKYKGYPVYLINFNQAEFPGEFLSNDFFTTSLTRQKLYNDEDLKCLMSLLKDLKPGLIGISVTSTIMEAAKIMTSHIKQGMNVPVCWGGVHAIIAPEECIQLADLVCLGEGEWTLFEAAERIRENRPLQNIEGLWIKNGGAIEKTEPRLLIENLDELPFPDFIDKGDKFTIYQGVIINNPPLLSGSQNNTYPIMTSRGCMFSCSFCCNSIIRQKYKGKGNYSRRRSVKNVIEELKWAVANKPVARIKFWDEIFTYDKDWINEFSESYLNEIGKPFVCYAHPNFTDQQIIAKLAQCGVIMVVIGIESGNEEVNKEIFNRTQSNKEILDFAKSVKKMKILLRYEMIVDNPYENDTQLNNTAKLLLKLPHPYRIIFLSLCYFPKTPLTERALQDKIITTQDVEQYMHKALNNFFLYLPLSINNRHLFWNCIFSMAVNRRFPKWFVRFCKRNNFFKRYPRIILIVARLYLKLFKCIRKRSEAITTVPTLINDVRLAMPNKVSFLLTKKRFHLLLYPSEEHKKFRLFTLRVINHFRIKTKVEFIFCMSPLFLSKNKETTLWATTLRLCGRYDTAVQLDLSSYPNLYVSFGDKGQKATLLKQVGTRTAHRKLYIFSVSIFLGIGKKIRPIQTTQVLLAA